jgi:hypothetical protein
MAALRRTAAVCALVAAAMSTVACGNGGGGSPDPGSTSIGPSGVGVIGTGPSESPSATAAAYPTNAEDYASAVIAAWQSDPTGLLGNLTTAQVHEQLIEIPGPLDMNWHLSMCDGAAGSSYCTFFNEDGDRLRLQLTNALLGQAHATVGVNLDQTQYPTTAQDYVTAFIEAWQQGNRWRMAALSNQNEVEYFTHYTPPEPGYDLCSDGAAGSTYVHVYNGAGLSYLIQVTNSKLGQANAIVAHSDVTPSCP